MRLLAWCLALPVLVGWLASAEAAAGKGKKGSKPVSGVVLSVKQDEGKDTGTITVQVRAKKKKGQTEAPAPEEKTFQVNASTKFTNVQKVKGQKGQTEQTPATLATVQKGGRVIIRAKGDVAEDVRLVQGKKKNK